MKLLKLRQKFQQLGFTLEQNQQGFIVDNGSVKIPFEKHFKNLEEVLQWVSDCGLKNNRLTEEECDQWDKNFKVFVLEQSTLRR